MASQSAALFGGVVGTGFFSVLTGAYFMDDLTAGARSRTSVWTVAFVAVGLFIAVALLASVFAPV